MNLRRNRGDRLLMFHFFTSDRSRKYSNLCLLGPFQEGLQTDSSDINWSKVICSQGGFRVVCVPRINHTLSEKITFKENTGHPSLTNGLMPPPNMGKTSTEQFDPPLVSAYLPIWFGNSNNATL